MIEQHGTNDNKFYTDTAYWDCECKKNYIHFKKKGNYCPKCKNWDNADMPDSRVNEIKEMYDEKTDCATHRDARIKER